MRSIAVPRQPRTAAGRIELAADRGLTLAGFARRGSVNVYAGSQRVV